MRPNSSWLMPSKASPRLTVVGLRWFEGRYIIVAAARSALRDPEDLGSAYKEGL